MKNLLRIYGKYVAYAAFITVPTSTPDDLTANLTSQVSDTGTLALLMLVAGIPLFFYVARRLIGLIPKGK